MVYSALGFLKKNSISTVTKTLLTAAGTTVTLEELAILTAADGSLLTKYIVFARDNGSEILTEEVTITGRAAASGEGDITGLTRGVNADGTIGAAHEWPIGTTVCVLPTIGWFNAVKANFSDHETRILGIPATLPNRNAIINGDCRVNQRVTAYTLVKDAYTWDASDLYGPDRHEGMATGTAVGAGTWGQSVTCSAGNSGYGFKFAGVTLTGTGILYHRHRIEAKDAARFRNLTASFSVKVYHDVGSNINYTIYVRKANTADNFSAVTAISNSGAIGVPSATATTLKYEAVAMGDCSNGIEIEIKIEAGAITTKNFEQTELQLELGITATAFENRPSVYERTLCTPYFLRYNRGAGIYVAFGIGECHTTTRLILSLNFPVTMRAPPTVTIVGNMRIQTAGSAISVTGTSTDANGTSTQSVLIYADVASGLNSGYAGQLQANGDGTADIYSACEL